MKIPALLISLLLVVAAYAEEEKKHPIDLKIEAAEEKAVSTVEMRKTYTDGLKLWDTELNRVYAELKENLEAKTFTALQAAQRQWLAYRNEQLKFLNAMYAEFDGTMYIPMRAAAEMEITRSRALELGRQLEIQKEHGGE